jgi:hypothetical protein
MRETIYSHFIGFLVFLFMLLVLNYNGLILAPWYKCVAASALFVGFIVAVECVGYFLKQLGEAIATYLKCRNDGF